MMEGKQLADYIANYALDKDNCIFTEFNGMETKERKIINNNKLNRPYIRVSP